MRVEGRTICLFFFLSRNPFVILKTIDYGLLVVFERFLFVLQTIKMFDKMSGQNNALFQVLPVIIAMTMSDE